MSKQYLSARSLEVIMNLKAQGATFSFEELPNDKHMLTAVLRSGETRNIIAVLSEDLYPFKESLDLV